MKSIPYTDTNGKSGFLNPEAVTHWHANGADEILVHFAKGGPISIADYTAGKFREALEA